MMTWRNLWRLPLVRNGNERQLADYLQCGKGVFAELKVNASGYDLLEFRIPTHQKASKELFHVGAPRLLLVAPKIRMLQGPPEDAKRASTANPASPSNSDSSPRM